MSILGIRTSADQVGYEFCVRHSALTRISARVIGRVAGRIVIAIAPETIIDGSSRCDTQKRAI